MPISQIDPVAALVVIDMQKGIVSLPTVHPMAGIIDNVAKLAKGFRSRMLPVILVNVTGKAPGRVEATFNFSPPPDWADLIPELDRQPDDYAVTKVNIGAFYGTALEMILRRRGVTQLVIVGVATGSGVEATARQAYDQGYNVVLVTDAMTDLDPDMHNHAVEKVFPRIGERGTTAEILEIL
jgi:nicotinamidase-related amidase